MNNIKQHILIVDDEALAREELRFLLSKIPSVGRINEANNIDEAEAYILQHHPDVILLDINMPGGSGFDLLERLTLAPAIIFTTAYSEHALKAFEVNALDYLLKPINPSRLTSALEKFTHTENAEQNKPVTLNRNSKIFLKDRDQCWLIPLSDIIYIEATGNYCRIHFHNAKPMIKKSLSLLEKKLPSDSFIRANRQEIINIQKIECIEALENQQLQVQLSNQQEVVISRRQSQLFKEHLSL